MAKMLLASVAFQILALFSILSESYGQLELSTFAEVEDALLAGHEVQAVFDLLDGQSLDSSKIDVLDATTLSLPLAPWNRLRYLNVTDSLVFSRSLVTQDGNLGAYFVNLARSPVGTVNGIVLMKVIDPVTFQSIATQDYYTQAIKFFDLTDGSETSEISDYETLRDSLTNGEGTISINTYLPDCNPGDPVEDYYITLGVPNVDRFYTVLPGTEDEFLVTYSSTISYDYGDFDLEYQRAINAFAFFPNGTVALLSQTQYGDAGTDIVQSFQTVCSLGSSVSVRKSARQAPERLSDWTSLSEALNAGRQLRIIVEELACENPSDMPVVAGYDVGAWEIFVDEQFGPVPHLGFSQYTFLGEGQFLLDEMRVYENNTVQIGFTLVDLITQEVQQSGVLKCDFGEATYFVTLDSPDKELLTSEGEIESAVLSGNTLYFVSPYNECRLGPGVEAIGGSAVKQIGIGDTGVAVNSHALISNYFTDEGFAWNSVPLYILQSGAAQFFPALYDADTWDNLYGDGYTYECDLFDGTSGSLYVYKAL